MPALGARATTWTFVLMRVEVKAWSGRVCGAIDAHVFSVSFNIINLNMCLFKQAKHFLLWNAWTSLHEECHDHVMECQSIRPTKVACIVKNHLLKPSVNIDELRNSVYKTNPVNIVFILLCFLNISHKRNNYHVFILLRNLNLFFLKNERLEFWNLIKCQESFALVLVKCKPYVLCGVLRFYLESELVDKLKQFMKFFLKLCAIN